MHERLPTAMNTTVMCSDFNPLTKICGAWKTADHYLLRGIKERIWDSSNTYFSLGDMVITPTNFVC